MIKFERIKEPEIFPLAEMFAKSQEGSIVCYDKYCGKIFLDVIDFYSGLTLSLYEASRIKAVCFFDKERSSFPMHIPLGGDGFFDKVESSLYESHFSEATVYFDNGDEQSVEIGFVFLGTDVNLETLDENQQQQKIYDLINQHKKHFSPTLQEWPRLLEKMRLPKYEFSCSML